MRKSPEGAAKTPYGIDTGRRLLVRVATLAGSVLAYEALSKTERAYAALKNALNFRERRKRVNPSNSPSLDAQVTTLVMSQGQPENIQDTPTPDATVAALQKKQLELQVQQLETQPSWFEKYVVPSLAPAIGLGTIG